MSTVFKDKVKKGLVCTHCSTPIVRVENDILIFSVKHHGERHISVIPLDKVLDNVVELAPAGIVRQDLGAR